MPAIRQEQVTIIGELAAWRAIRDGWGFGELRAGKERIAFTGSLVGVRLGDTVEACGVWVEHPKFGRQLKVKTCTPAALERSTAGLVPWLASTLPDVGEERARQMVERFGDQLWDVILMQHERLTEVPGITSKRADAIREAYMRHVADRDDMIRLRGWGLTDSQIARCVEQWGELDETVRRIQSNPYELTSTVHGFGFKRADAVAQRAGVKLDAPERLRAGVEFVVDEAGGEGHCYLSGAALQRMAAELLGVPAKLIGAAIKAAAEPGGRLVRRDWRVYPVRLDRAEAACARGFARMIAG